ALCARYEAELNQILSPDGRELPEVRAVDERAAFDCDALLFTASAGVPPASQTCGDVRMAQFDANRRILRAYGALARETGFSGLFAQIADPVDRLSRALFLDSNTAADGKLDFNGLLPEQVRGYGLGVMRARALYAASSRGAAAPRLRAYGPHGRGLVIANDPCERYDNALSLSLTQDAVNANLRVRELGYKPYIAPGISSACAGVLRTLRGEWHDAAVPMGGAYFGCTARVTPRGGEVLREPLHPELMARLCAEFSALAREQY
ncbi:MAG: lactate dehydrogenase, partial [Clostridia bacterium]|nr:lactate dehydrogenase [Clostridia bacterium]